MRRRKKDNSRCVSTGAGVADTQSINIVELNHRITERTRIERRVIGQIPLLDPQYEQERQ